LVNGWQLAVGSWQLATATADGEGNGLETAKPQAVRDGDGGTADGDGGSNWLFSGSVFDLWDCRWLLPLANCQLPTANCQPSLQKRS
jgi:hypothetical protein